VTSKFAGVFPGAAPKTHQRPENRQMRRLRSRIPKTVDIFPPDIDPAMKMANHLREKVIYVFNGWVRTN
jgi:hypothetical protein